MRENICELIAILTDFVWKLDSQGEGRARGLWGTVGLQGKVGKEQALLDWHVRKAK